MTFLQYCIFGIIAGSGYGVMGVSFGLIYSVTQRFHFAWATGFAIAGFFSAWLATLHSIPPVPAILIATAAAVAFGVGTEVFLYRPVAKRWSGNTLLGIFVVSFGLTIAAQNVIELLVLSGTVVLNWISVKPVYVGSLDATVLDLVFVPVAWGCGAATWALLRYTGVGRRIRAVRSNPVMAEAIGIDAKRTYVIVFAFGTLLSSVVGVYYAMKYAGTPEMGLTPVFYAFVVTFLAGVGSSPVRIMAVGTALGVVESVSALVFSPDWEQVAVFVILLGLVVYKALCAWRPALARPLLAGRR